LILVIIIVNINGEYIIVITNNHGNMEVIFVTIYDERMMIVMINDIIDGQIKVIIILLL